MPHRSFALSRRSKTSVPAYAALVSVLTRCLLCSSSEHEVDASLSVGVGICTSGNCSPSGEFTNETDALTETEAFAETQSRASNFLGESGECVDWEESCPARADEAACLTNAGYMAYYCPVSCGTCEALALAEDAFAREEHGSGDACMNHDYGCAEWAAADECDGGNAEWMTINCPRACAACEDDGVASALEGRLDTFRFPGAGDGLADYMNPKLFEDPGTIDGIKRRIRAGHAIVIRNAFKIEYAEAMYRELSGADDAFELHKYHDDTDHFACHHHNIYDAAKYTPLMDATVQLFNSSATKAFASDLSGRRCGGDTVAAASHYKPGDHSLPHTDFYEERTVAYVWHLSKNWQTGWGGHLYWCNEHAAKAYLDASFNTLVLFSVNPKSHHMVTAVNELAGDEKRLTINAWWNDPWLPSFDEDTEEFAEGYSHFEDYFSEDDARMGELTHSQMNEIDELKSNCEEGSQPESVSSERCANVQSVADRISDFFYPDEYEAVDVIHL